MKLDLAIPAKGEELEDEDEGADEKTKIECTDDNNELAYL